MVEGGEKKKNRQIRPTLGLFSTYLLHIYDQNCSFSYTPYVVFLTQKLRFAPRLMRVGKQNLARVILHGNMKRWRLVVSFFRPSVKVKAAKKSRKFVKLRVKNKTKGEIRKDQPPVFHTAMKNNHANFCFLALKNHGANCPSQNVHASRCNQLEACLVFDHGLVKMSTTIT